MPIDFRASNIQTQKLIASGTISSSGRSQLAVYPIEDQDTGSPNQGQISTRILDKIQGSDVFLFVSGSTNSKGGTTQGTVLFNGDVHISGNLSIDGSGGGGGGGSGGIPTFISNSLGDVVLTTDVVGDGSDKSILGTINGAQILGVEQNFLSASVYDSANGLQHQIALGDGSVVGFFDAAFLASSNPSDTNETAAFYSRITNPQSTSSSTKITFFTGNGAGDNSTMSSERRLSGAVVTESVIRNAITRNGDTKQIKLSYKNSTGPTDNLFYLQTDVDLIEFGEVLSRGEDVFFYVSGGINEKNSSNRTTALFGGDVHVSGNLHIDSVGAIYGGSPLDKIPLSIFGLTALSSSGNSGADVNIYAGAGDNDTTDGGNLSLGGGEAFGNKSNAGNVSITGGSHLGLAPNDGYGGSINIDCGSGNNGGGLLELNGGDSDEGSAGGIDIKGGSGLSSGGSVSLQAGTSRDGDGADVTIASSNGSEDQNISNRFGGSINFSTGNGYDGGHGGDVIFTLGSGQDNQRTIGGGNFQVTAGSSEAGPAGQIVLSGGLDISQAGSFGGDVNLLGGASTNGQGGNVNIAAGSGNTTGSINIGIDLIELATINIGSSVQPINNYGIVGFFNGHRMLAEVVSGNSTITFNQYYIPISASAPTTITISGSVDGQTHIIKDAVGNGATHNITLSSSKGSIDGSSTYLLATNYASVNVVYCSTLDVWSVL